jgi:hypothetical protein
MESQCQQDLFTTDLRSPPYFCTVTGQHCCASPTNCAQSMTTDDMVLTMTRRIEGSLTDAFERQAEVQTRFTGRGRGPSIVSASNHDSRLTSADFLTGGKPACAIIGAIARAQVVMCIFEYTIMTDLKSRTCRAIKAHHSIGETSLKRSHSSVPPVLTLTRA